MSRLAIVSLLVVWNGFSVGPAEAKDGKGRARAEQIVRGCFHAACLVGPPLATYLIGHGIADSMGALQNHSYNEVAQTFGHSLKEYFASNTNGGSEAVANLRGVFTGEHGATYDFGSGGVNLKLDEAIGHLKDRMNDFAEGNRFFTSYLFPGTAAALNFIAWGGRDKYQSSVDKAAIRVSSRMKRRQPLP